MVNRRQPWSVGGEPLCFRVSAREVGSSVTRGQPGRAARLDPPQPDVPRRVRGAARMRAPLVRCIFQGRAPHLAAAAQPAGRGHGRGLAAPVRRPHPARGAQDRRAAVRRARSGRVGAGVGYPILPLRCGARARAASSSSCSQLPGSIAQCPGPATAGRAQRWRMFRQPAALQGCWQASASVGGAGCSAPPSPLQGAGSLWGESSL